MLVTCWSVKGGSGTTTIAAALALLAASSGPATLVDLAGDAPGALGRAGVGGGGLVAATAGPDPVGAVHLLHRRAVAGGAPVVLERGPGRFAAGAGDDLLTALASVAGTVVVDAGTLREDTTGPGLDLAAASSLSLLVVRPCFLALQRAVQAPLRASGLVIVGEPGRALDRSDVEAVLDLPVWAEVPWDPAVARSVDAGLLATRLPASLRRRLGHAA